MPYSVEPYSTEAFAGNPPGAPPPAPTSTPIYSQGFWKSGPQAVQDAVVCLYLDLRDSNEKAQVFDTLDIEPLFSGNAMNIYYSSDDTIPSVFSISRNYQLLAPPYPSSITTPISDSTSITGLDFGQSQYLTVSNALLALQPLINPFSMGLTAEIINPTSPHALASIQTTDGYVDLVVTGGTLVINVRSSSGSTLGTSSTILDVSTSNSIIWGWDGTQWIVYINGSLATLTGDTTVGPGNSPVSVTNFGYTPDTSVAYTSSGTYMAWAWIRQQAPNSQVALQYDSNPDGMIDAKGAFDVTNGSYNALLLGRFTVDSSAFVGPNSQWFTSKTWTPLQRDFSLQKGIYTIPTVNAKYLKLEISNLTVQPYLFDGDYITKVVQLFPDWVTSYYQSVQNTVANNTANIYQSFNSSNVSPQAPYNNIPTSTLFGAGKSWLTNGSANPSLLYQSQSTQGSYTWIYPNTTTVVKDPTSSINSIDLTGAQANLFNNDNNVSTWLFPRFPFVGTHQYKYMSINQTWKQAYYTGIISIALYYASNIIATNTPEYFEPGYNSSDLLSLNQLTYTEGIGYVCNLPGEEMVTQVLTSITPLQSVQIAGVTSDWSSNGVPSTDIICNSNFTGLNGNNPAWIPYNSDLVFNSSNNLVSVTPNSMPPNADGYGILTSESSTLDTNLLTPDDAYFITDTPGAATSSNWKDVSNITTVSGGIPTGYPEQYPSTLSLKLDPVTNGDMTAGISNYAVVEEFTYQQLPYGETKYGELGANSFIPATYEWMVSVLNNTNSVQRTVTVEMYYYGEDGSTILVDYVQSFIETNNMEWPSTPFYVYGPTVEGAAFTGVHVTVEGAEEEHMLNYAGLFLLPAPDHTPITVWVPPSLYTARRVSAAGRVYIPRHAGLYGTYVIELLFGGSVIASQTYQGTPNSFIDMEVVYINNVDSSPSNFQARIRQSNSSVAENFYTAMLGVFFHPIQWSISFYDDVAEAWTEEKTLSSVINNPYGFVVPNTLDGTATQMQVTLTAMAHGAVVNSFVIKPIYIQSPLTPLATIQNYPNPFVNEIGTMRGTSQHPHFRLWNKFYPQIYSQQYVSYISNQTS